MAKVSVTSHNTNAGGSREALPVTNWSHPFPGKIDDVEHGVAKVSVTSTKNPLSGG